MTITKPKAKITPEAFISAAPDAAAPDTKPKYVKKGKKLQITLTITPALLERVDQLAIQLGQSRAAVINLAVYQGLESGLAVQAKDRHDSV